MHVPMQMCGKGEKETCSLTEPCALGLRYKQYKQSFYITSKLCLSDVMDLGVGMGLQRTSMVFVGGIKVGNKINYVIIIIIIIPYFIFIFL